jgi:hypothetical protein
LAGELGAITSELEELAERLTALLELYKDDPAMASRLDHVVAARDKALRAAELAQQGGGGRSLDISIH